MNAIFPTGFWFVVFSIYACFVLAIFPLGDVLATLRPLWVLLIVLYWVRNLPSYFGLSFAFVVGLLCDVLLVTPLGSNALALVCIVYLYMIFQRQIKVFTTLQQAVLVFLVSLLFLFVLRQIDNFFGNSVEIGLGYWVPAIVNAIFWPWFSLVMDGLKTRVGIYEIDQ